VSWLHTAAWLHGAAGQYREGDGRGEAVAACLQTANFGWIQTIQAFYTHNRFTLSETSCNAASCL